MTAKSKIWRVRRLYDGLKPIDVATMAEFEALPINDDLYIEVKDMSKKEIRRACQNRLYFGWLHDAEKTTCNEMAGTLAADWHLQMKRMFLKPIYERESQDWAETFECIREVYRTGLKDHAEHLVDNIIKNQLSTTYATVEQFCEYLNCIEQYFHSKGVLLRTDAGLYKEAFEGK